MEFKEGQTVSLYVSEILEVNEEKFIFLSDGIKDTYRVLPFDFQLELGIENMPHTLNCYVKAVNIFGLPLLQQSRKDILETCYTDFGTEYPFKIIGVSDPGVSPMHYFLKDSFGIKHRYYPKVSEPIRETNDIFSLIIDGVNEKDGNRSHLDFRPVEAELSVVGDHSAISPVGTIPDPRKESAFGVEGHKLEFKSTIVFPAGGIEPNIDKQMRVILKTIAAFQNSEGGTLYIGVNDSGSVAGIEYDFPYLNSGESDPYKNYSPTTDHYELKIRNAIRVGLGPYSNGNVNFEFLNQDGKTYCKIEVTKCVYPVFRSDSKLFQRAGNMIQILEKDEITWFIEDRLRHRENTGTVINQSLSKNITQLIEDDQVEVDFESKQTSVRPLAVVEPIVPYFAPVVTQEETKVWVWMVFYNNGTWSFGNKKLAGTDIIYQVPIPMNHRNGRLVMVYKNGCVNIVCPHEIIKPRSAKGGRSQKTANKIYQNGWNTKSEILKIFTADANDLLYFRSIQNSGVEWIKVHRVSAISVHTGLALEGNVLVNSRLLAKIVQVEKVENMYFPMISPLVLKDHQTSGYLGYRTSESTIKLALSTMQKIIEKQNSID